MLETYTQTARELMEKDLPGSASRITVSEGRTVLPFDGIMEAATDHSPDLIVIGTHGHSLFSRLLMGSTAEKVLRHAECSVLTVRAGTPIPGDGRFRKILVPVDFSESAGCGLDGARAIRSDDESTLYLVHVIDPAPPMYLAGNVSSYFELDPDLRNRLETNLRTWSGDIPGSHIVIAEGNPALEVARLSEELGVDLIVMGTKGLTGVERPLVGSVTERVGRFAPVPVLAMRRDHGEQIRMCSCNARTARIEQPAGRPGVLGLFPGSAAGEYSRQSENSHSSPWSSPPEHWWRAGRSCWRFSVTSGRRSK